MKKYLIAGCFFLSLLAFRNKLTPNNSPAEIKSSVNKSLRLLESSSHAFLKNVIQLTNCHSCHNQGLGLVAFALAKDNGFLVTDTIFKEAIDSTCHYWKMVSNLQTLAENDDPVAIVMSGNYDLWALSAANIKADKNIALLTMNIMRKQGYDGSWASPGQRPPLEYYSFSATALSIKNIRTYVPSAWQEEVNNRIDKARVWLMNTKAETNEERIFQLLGLMWSKGDRKMIGQLGKQLLARQHADGGWSQLDSLGTDAYATGQSLYALYQTKTISTADPVFQKGISFLLKTQLDDGSWHVKTRSYPFVPYVYSGFPHEKDQFISAAGSNWATMALLLAAGKIE